MSSKIYVGGLPYSTTETQLRDLFEPHGTVESARVVTDKFTNKSRGFAFVEMSTEEEAEAAIAALNGTELEGRTLAVSKARPQEPRAGGDRFGRDRGRSGPGRGRSGSGGPGRR
jgi:RNA recognition motif-containing protein